MNAIASEPEGDGRRLAGLERRIGTLTTQIGKTLDLAAELANPAPVLRRVQDLEHQRASLVDELARLREQRTTQAASASIDATQMRALLPRLFAEISESAAKAKPGRRSAARQALSQVVERIELDPIAQIAHLHFAVRGGDNLASPRGFEPL
jgi:hypothetical protein